jgi:hypothetical protein
VTNSRIRTDVNVSSGGATDSVLLYGDDGEIVVVGGSMVINSGSGDDGLVIATATAGSLVVSTGDGMDLMTVFKSTVGVNTLISTLGGDDTIQFRDVAVRYGLTVDLGAGNDVISLENTRALAAWLYGGPGTNTLDLDAASRVGIRRIYTYRLNAVR